MQMMLSTIIVHDPDNVMDTDYFLDRLREKWSGAKIQFPTDFSAQSFLQFQILDRPWILGEFSGTKVSYKSYFPSDIAQFALWYRSIAPSVWDLRLYDAAMSFDFIFLTEKTTQEQIIAGFETPFNIRNFFG